MIFLIISVVLSVSVGVLLKLAKRYQIDVIQAIAFNYLMAIGLSLLFFDPQTIAWKSTPYTLYGVLGVLLPAIFLCLAHSIRDFGIVKTDISQRLSLVIPLTASWFLFNDTITVLKLIGLIVGFVSIWLILNRKEQQTVTKKSSIVFPILVFVGFGIIDILFKFVAKFTAVPYTTSLFLIFVAAFLVSMIFLTIQWVQGKHRFQFINLICGLILGLFNFGNILFYLKAHKHFQHNPSTVFASMNFGVIVLGTLVGYYIFKEPVSKLNTAGILLAIAAIAIITISQVYVI